MTNPIKRNPENVRIASKPNNVTFCLPSDGLSARDRLLAALKSSPSIDPEDAEIIELAVRRSREESMVTEVFA